MMLGPVSVCRLCVCSYVCSLSVGESARQCVRTKGTFV